MHSRISEKALEEYLTLVEEKFGPHFSEGGTYDFTRCVRPNGTAYGTGGKCRKGTETAKVDRNPDSLFLQGEKVNLFRLDTKAKYWRDTSGLESPNNGIDKHDRVHVLLHEFMGGSNQISNRIRSTQRSPTVGEELLVSRIHDAATLKGKGKSHRLSDEELLKKISDDLVAIDKLFNIPRGERDLIYYRAGKPNAQRFLEIYREMESDPDFDKLLDAAYAAFPDYSTPNK